MTDTALLVRRAAAAGSDDWRAMFAAPLSELGGDVADLIRSDRAREERTVNMIASGSYSPFGLRQAEGSHLVNKNASGLPGRRSMANCEEADAIELLAISRAKALFGAEAVNVQALSSTLANVAVLRAIMPPGGRLLSFDELSGGHVSHGAANHITSAGITVRSFGVDGSGRLDVSAARKAALDFRPDVIVAGATSYPRAVDFKGLREVADEAGALLFSDIAHVAGLVAVGLHENAVPYSDVATTSTQKTLCGPRGGAFTFSKARHADAIDRSIYPGMQGPAPVHMIAARAVQLEMVGRPAFRALMEAVLANAQALCEGLLEAGCGLYTGGTDTHMALATAPAAGWTPSGLVQAFGKYGVTGNGMRIPAPGGGGSEVAYRFGSTAMTVRGMGVGEFRTLGALFGRIMAKGPDARVNAEVRGQIKELALGFPVPSYVD